MERDGHKRGRVIEFTLAGRSEREGVVCLIGGGCNRDG